MTLRALSVKIFVMDELNIKDKKISDSNLMDSMNAVYGHITDKIQRITGALYRVTDLLSDKEPLKWILRDKAMVLYNNIMSIRFIKDKDSVLDDTLGCLFQMIKSLELVSMGFCVSNLNFEILKREYAGLKNFIEGKKSNIIAEQKLLLKIPSRKENQRKRRENVNLMAITTENNNIQESLSDESGVASQGSRKRRILDFMMVAEGEKTVSEIAAIFNGEIGEKAVQRDLFDLVQSGELLAKGDKRWRKYAGNFSESINPPIALSAPKEALKINLTGDSI